MDIEAPPAVSPRPDQALEEDSALSGTSATAADRLREIEFYRYYEPFKAAVASGGRSRANGVLRSSDDRALTAFAQLGALRLGARRCAISLFDRKTQYVLAEATKTLSLQSDESEDPNDALLWGVAEFPLGSGLCQYTMRMPMQFVDLDNGHRAEVAVNCFPDMLEDVRFRDLPFVCGTPQTRFYAAVPIRSPSGVSLGSYCVMGDEPKPGLTRNEIAFLKDMATTVMVHLEMVRAREEIRRNALFIHGLGSFIEGESSIREGRRAVRESAARNNHGKKWYEEQYAMQQVSSVRQPDAFFVETSEPALAVSNNGNLGTPADLLVGKPVHTSDLQSPDKINSELPKQSDHASSNKNIDKRKLQSFDIRDTFARAANIIQECLDVDGVVMYDASVGTFAGLVDTDSDTDDSRSLDEAHKAILSTPKDDSSSESMKSDAHSEVDNKISDEPCTILGFSTPRLSALRDDQPPETLRLMTEKVLRRLMRRHPFGRVFSLNSPGTSPARAILEPQMLHTSNNKDRGQKARQLRRSEIKFIRKVFPDVRSIMLVPFYDINKQCYYAGGIIWSTNAQLIFSQEQALTYLAAFADSVMAEVARIEVKSAEKTKSDFISSISHELRSPLHGILGSVECLQDTDDSALSKEMLHTVETCGKTLLDTVDHLLDFAKINNFSRSATSTQSIRASVRQKSQGSKNANKGFNTRNVPLHGERAHDLETAVDLATVTQEVIKTVQAGRAYTDSMKHREQHGTTDRNSASSIKFRGTQTITVPSGEMQKGVEVIIDIDQGPKTGWFYQTQAGAWRRIVMNLIGNALKYTAKGHVRVALRVIPSLVGEHDEIVLSVSDTGCGMSKEFQDTQLFKPFAQENYLAPGTGLGMSIIKQILKDIGGEIMVKSEKGKGTVVEVKIVLARSPSSPAHNVVEEISTLRFDEAILTPDITSSDFDWTSTTTSWASSSTVNSSSNGTSRQNALATTPNQPLSPNTTPRATDPKPMSKRVLLVEDNSINLRLLIAYMKKQGYYYETAQNGLEALEAFQTATSKMQPRHPGEGVANATTGADETGVATTVVTAFDFVLMDISMPVMDGLESTREIRTHERKLAVSQQSHNSSYKPATIIALTGLASMQTRQEAYSSGVNYFMPKPVKLAELTKMMTEAGP